LVSLLSPIPIIISVQQCRPSWDVPVVLQWGSKGHLKLHSEVGAVPRQVDVYRAGGGSRQGPESREQRTTSGCNLGVCANGVAAAAACLHTALPLACCQVFAEILPPAPDSSPSQKKNSGVPRHDRQKCRHIVWSRTRLDAWSVDRLHAVSRSQASRPPLYYRGRRLDRANPSGSRTAVQPVLESI
jgi:hypothetical protein